MISSELSSAYAQMVFFNLVKADQNGAIAARFKDGEYTIYPGPLVDKDSFEETAKEYGQCLVEKGVPLRDALGTIERIKNRFYGGTPIEQHEILNNLDYVTAMSKKQRKWSY